MAKTFNLTALSERLMTESRLKPLVGKIRRVQDLASLHTDLAIALESMDALDVLVATPDTSDINRHVTEAALLNSAIMLYARATKTTSKQRRNFDLRTRFSPEELVVHEELVDLRDEAIAHFREALKRSPEDDRPRVALARCYLDLGRVGHAAVLAELLR